MAAYIKEKHQNDQYWPCVIEACKTRFIRRSYLHNHLHLVHKFNKHEARRLALNARRISANVHAPPASDYYEDVSSDDEDYFDLLNLQDAASTVTSDAEDAINVFDVDYLVPTHVIVHTANSDVSAADSTNGQDVVSGLGSDAEDAINLFNVDYLVPTPGIVDSTNASVSGTDTASDDDRGDILDHELVQDEQIRETGDADGESDGVLCSDNDADDVSVKSVKSEISDCYQSEYYSEQTASPLDYAETAESSGESHVDYENSNDSYSVSSVQSSNDYEPISSESVIGTDEETNETDLARPDPGMKIKYQVLNVTFTRRMNFLNDEMVYSFVNVEQDYYEFEK